MKILIANSNVVHASIVNGFAEKIGAKVITTQEELRQSCKENLFDYIFFLHWSYIIPATIYSKQECVLFHMTDLPYGRGGSPLQNLIVRGHERTMLSALKVSKGLDTGPIYLKKELQLHGTAREIFLRAGELMLEMMQSIISERPDPIPQNGAPLLFTRRNSSESNLTPLKELKDVYDYIRMLDAAGYPPAFVETEYFKFDFSRASFHGDQIIADVRITKK